MTPTMPEAMPEAMPRRRKPSLLRRVAFVMVGLMTCGIIGMIVLWNSPTAFQWVSVRLACVATGLELREVEVDGHVIPYLERPARGPVSGEGNPQPTVLCLHGFGTSKESCFVLSQMAPGTRFIAPDLPPFGESDPAAVTDYDPANLVAYIDRFAIAVQARPAIVLGTSMGGALAVAYAHAHPEAVTALVLLAPAGVQAPVENEFVRQARAGGNPLRIASAEDLDRVLEMVFFHPPATPAPIKAFLVEQALATREARDQAAEQLGPWLLEDGILDALVDIQQPTLVVFGAEDRVIDPSCLAVFQSQLPHSTCTTIPGAGHVVFADAPLATRDAIAAFLSNLGGEPARPAAQ